jgi:hypothetical protein
MRDASLRLGIAAVNEPKTLWRSVARCNRALRWVDSVEEVRKQIGVASNRQAEGVVDR